MDQDGDPDVVSGNRGQPIVAYLYNGSGEFTEMLKVSNATHRTYCVAAGDLNGDGYPDIVAANSNGPDIVYLNSYGG